MIPDALRPEWEVEGEWELEWEVEGEKHLFHPQTVTRVGGCREC